LTEQIKEPKLVISKIGRPAIDWAALFDEWVVTKKRKAVFLREYGINPSSGAAIKNTSGWTQGIKKAAKAVADANGLFEPQKEVDEIYKMVTTWRKGQSINDFKVTDNLRLHIKVILNNALTKYIGPDGQEKVKTSLKTKEIRDIAGALEAIQRIQRLALGLSTQNVGVGIESRIESNDIENDVNPIFVVEVNENGKFVKARPTQLR